MLRLWISLAIVLVSFLCLSVMPGEVYAQQMPAVYSRAEAKSHAEKPASHVAYSAAFFLHKLSQNTQRCSGIFSPRHTTPMKAEDGLLQAATNLRDNPKKIPKPGIFCGLYTSSVSANVNLDSVI